MRSSLEAAIRRAVRTSAAQQGLQATEADVDVVAATVTTAALASLAPTRQIHLSPQQLAVLHGLAAGDRVEDTARRLHVGVNTVKTHQRRLYRALGAHTGAQTVAVAMRLGLLTGFTAAPTVPAQSDRRSA